jgi:hypothetical protein
MAKQIIDPYRQLASAIILQSVSDWKSKRKRRMYKKELVLFFWSDLFEMLASIVDLDPSTVREELDVPKCVY